jgi:hypothetical protein
MTIVRRLWRAAKYVVGVIASHSGLAGFAFVVGGFVWGMHPSMLNSTGNAR